MFTEDEVKIRAAKCRSLLNFGPYQEIVADMEEFIESTKEEIIGYLIEGLTEKAMIGATIIAGVRRVLNQPIEAIEEANNLNENSEPS